MGKVGQWDKSFAIPTNNYLQENLSGPKRISGTVATTYGIVEVASYQFESGAERTALEFIWDGKMHLRHFNRFYRARFLVTLAKRFAEEVIGEIDD